MGRVISFLLLLVLVGCGDTLMSPETATGYLQRHGYTDIHTTGGASMMCGQNGPGAVGFTAKDPKGIKVSGAVCENYGGGFVLVTD